MCSERCCAGLPAVDIADTDPVDLDDPAEAMYPHLERMANAAVDQYGTVLREGVQWLPRHVARLRESVGVIQSLHVAGFDGIKIICMPGGGLTTFGL
jgi:hypothetical protein